MLRLFNFEQLLALEIIGLGHRGLVGVYKFGNLIVNIVEKYRRFPGISVANNYFHFF